MNLQEAELLLNEIKKSGLKLDDYEAKLIAGVTYKLRDGYKPTMNQSSVLQQLYRKSQGDCNCH